MDSVSTHTDLPTVEWVTRLAEINKADLAEFRKLGEVDCRLAVNIFDGGPDGSALIVQLRFDGFDIDEIKEIGETELESMDFVIETDRDSWLEMVDNIRAGDGRPDLDHSLNALSMAATPIRVWSSDPLGRDMFFRYNQSLQHFINNCARL
ncbi:hypothetical protein [Candidatus Mycolicibacterium alkanivorans]|uniref:Uncharacterized protein n=1 Tax=Candidatus Mycolicibacterium alkanivorans TaxID=2954114 RepID=A0ABS9YYZ1_9MYCO|nr:hypothetical protein [Candidatus Mycolicibacterium alkanivorans]MCI4676468.1 hypothetical protein [Candidatus Mycolicibacterium alkanivorans]